MHVFLIRRAISVVITLLVVTLILFGIAMTFPIEERAMLYFPVTNRNLTPAETQAILNRIIREHQLDQPFLSQYGYWIKNLLQGNWGYTPTYHMNVLTALVNRTPASVELILYSLLFFIPLGILSGVWAAGRQGQWGDRYFRMAAFIATALPPFILAIMLLSIFYVGLYWFPIGRLSDMGMRLVNSTNFHSYTSLLTIDGFLNGHPEISLDALRRLVLPVITLSLIHWATLGRITRASTIEELGKEYVTAARGHGISERKILWWHTLRNVLVPALNSSALSVATLITGLYIIEIIFLYNGISTLFTRAIQIYPWGGPPPDVVLALGFAIYNVLAVIAIMTILDLLQVALDPRIRQRVRAL